jgi:hypothetical protein
MVIVLVVFIVLSLSSCELIVTIIITFVTYSSSVVL